MEEKNECQFSRTPITIMFLISCLILMGCNCNNNNVDWSDKDADFLIIQLKNNRDYELREKAVYLLASKAQQERDKVIPALTHVLFNDEYGLVRAAAVDVLGSIEPPAVSAIPALIEALLREDRGAASLRSNELGVHEAAIKSLREMGPDAAEAIPALTEVFRSDERYLRYIRDDAGLAILKIDPSMHTVKEELIERRAVWQLAELAEAGDVSLVPVLIQSLNDPDPPHGSTPGRAAEALKDIGTPEALDAVVAFYIQELDYPSDYVRCHAAEELKDIGTPKALDAAVPVLIQLLKAPETMDDVRKRAAEELKDIGTPEALEAIKEFEKRRWWPF
ncbi:MAG: HEAT repeat domain-containing protein [Candidatus Poribacteria bacterium]|nr:HEAT repeat domain-containing protein [Candidatus Poribacteria bacterium]